MSLWGKDDTLAATPKYVARKATFNSASTSVVNATDNNINLLPSNTGFNTGDAVYYSIAGGTVIGGLTDATTYTVRVVGAGLIELYDTYAHAIAAEPTKTGRLDITSVGVGAQTLQRTHAANTFKDHIYNGSQIIFVDLDEARQPENRARGIKNVGWWAYRSWTNADTSVQHRAECLVALSSHRDLAGATGFNNQATTGDDSADDAIAVDATTSISVQPVNKSAVAPAGTTFTVTSTATGAFSSLTYQWQADNRTGYGFRDITVANEPTFTGYNTSTLTISDTTGLDTYKFRVICGTDTANTNVVSNEVLLTVTV